MRIPKYKAYYKFDEKIYDVVAIYFDTKEVCLKKIIKGKVALKVVAYHEVELMEYTGVEDYYNGEIVYDEEIEMNGKIYFEEGRYKVDFINGMCWLLRDCEYSKKVGNIYQNKELMEGEI